MLYDPRQDEVNRDLLNAATLIRDTGFCQYSLWSSKGEHCIRGALMEVMGVDDLSFRGMQWGAVDKPRLDRAEARILAITGGRDVPDWNNHPGRTKEEVVEVLCKAAGVSAEVLV